MTNSEFKWKHFAPEIILWCLRLKWPRKTGHGFRYNKERLFSNNNESMVGLIDQLRLFATTPY